MVKAIWPQVIHRLQPQLEQQLPNPEGSSSPHQPPSTACNVPASPPGPSSMPSPICSQPLTDLPPSPLEPSHAVSRNVNRSPNPTCSSSPYQPSEPVPLDGEAGDPGAPATHFHIPGPAPNSDTGQAYSAPVPGALEQRRMHTTATSKRHSDTAAVLGTFPTHQHQAMARSRFRSPGEAIRSQSVTHGRPRWQRWVGVQARLAGGELNPLSTDSVPFLWPSSDQTTPIAPRMQHYVPCVVQRAASACTPACVAGFVEVEPPTPCCSQL